MSAIRVLHISDLHARAEWAADQREIAEAMLKDVSAIARSQAFDLAVFSGDLAFAGKAEEFALARELVLEPLREQLGLGSDQVIVVPGNHDVDRSRVDEIVELGLAGFLCDREKVNKVLDDDVRLIGACERLDAWEEFRTDFYSGDQPRNSQPLAHTWSLKLHGTAVGVAALNSAWRCSSDNERGRLLLGDRQVKNALAALDEADARLVVVHHPIDWLMSFDQDLVRGLFEQRMTIVFSGHEHAADPVSEMGSRGQAIYSRAGCLYESHAYSNSYNIVDIDAATGRVEITIRAWLQRRRVFDAALDRVEDGRLKFTLSMDRLLPVAPSQYTPVLQGLGDLAHEVSVVADRLSERGDSDLTRFRWSRGAGIRRRGWCRS